MVNATAHGLKSLPLGVLHICICILILSAIPSDAYARVKKNKGSGKSQSAGTPDRPGKTNASPENARVMLLTGNLNGAVIDYAQSLSKDSLNISLNSEYAYALALNGIYDAALARFDRIWGNRAGNTDAVFFAAQVYTLMGYDQLAAELMNDPARNKAPQWISSETGELTEKYKMKLLPGVTLTGDQVVENFKRANRLTAQGSYLQAIGLFEEIITQYPGEYLPYVGYSIALEKTGLYGRSAWAVDAALKITENDPEQKDAKQFLDKRLSAIKSKSVTPQQDDVSVVKPAAASVSKSNNLMLYAGGMVSSAYTSINSRFGYFLSESTNVAVDAGISSVSGNTSYILGLSFYQRRRIIVGGFGLNGYFGNGSNSLYWKMSAGFSFMSKRNNSSWDIFMDGQVPFSRSQATIIGMSIGRSIYFGTRN